MNLYRCLLSCVWIVSSFVCFLFGNFVVVCIWLYLYEVRKNWYSMQFNDEEGVFRSRIDKIEDDFSKS